MLQEENKKFYKQLGVLIKDTRNEKKMSLDDMRQKMKQPKAKSTLKRYEDGGSSIPVSTLEDLCDALRLNLDYVYAYLRNDKNNPYDKYLAGSISNSEYQGLIHKTKSELPATFIQEYAKMNDFHKNMIWQLIQTYAREDTEKEGEDHGSHKE